MAGDFSNLEELKGHWRKTKAQWLIINLENTESGRDTIWQLVHASVSRIGDRC